MGEKVRMLGGTDGWRSHCLSRKNESSDTRWNISLPPQRNRKTSSACSVTTPLFRKQSAANEHTDTLAECSLHLREAAVRIFAELRIRRSFLAFPVRLIALQPNGA